MGASFSSVAANESWAQDEGFQYELWTDQDKTLAVYYGAAASQSALWVDRVTRVLDADGTLLLEYGVGSDIAGHPGFVLEDCRKLFGN